MSSTSLRLIMLISLLATTAPFQIPLRFLSPRLLTTSALTTSALSTTALSSTLPVPTPQLSLLPPLPPLPQQPINWYPGHIASAEKKLSNILPSADLIIEVRDARLAHTSAHPSLTQWSPNTSRIVLLSKSDLASPAALRDFRLTDFAPARHYEFQTLPTLPAATLKKTIVSYAGEINNSRIRRGISPRAVRVVIVGYPNVGKSLLINKLLGKNRVKSENRPGVTQSFSWIQVKGSVDTSESNRRKDKAAFELLDTPGIILSKLPNQHDAMLLAAVNCVSDKTYDRSTVASYLLGHMRNLFMTSTSDAKYSSVGDYAAPGFVAAVMTRYGVTFDEHDGGEDLLHAIADATCRGDLENAANKCLQDFRNGRWGPVTLEVREVYERRTARDSFDKKNQEGEKKVDTGDSRDRVYDDRPAVKGERLGEVEEEAKEMGVQVPEGGGAKGIFDGW